MLSIIKMKLFHINTKVYYILFSFLILCFQGCNTTITGNEKAAESASHLSKSDFLLNTIITINLYDQQDDSLIEDCFDLISRYEKIFSRTDENSELYEINHKISGEKDQTFEISDELSDLIRQGLSYCELSQGAFDITIAPLSSLWNFKTSTPVIPDVNEIQNVLSLINYKNVILNENELSFLQEDMGIDLGAIAKGYIADRVKDYLISRGVKSAMINLGGNILCIGSKPDGSPFTIGIQKPFADRNEIIGTMDIQDMSVVTSGIYERYFNVDGILYHHILNPKSGYPYENHLIAVTILSKNSVDGDGLSTSCFALGLDKGLKLIESLSDTYAIFITDDYEVTYSKGLKEIIPLHIN